MRYFMYFTRARTRVNDDRSSTKLFLIVFNILLSFLVFSAHLHATPPERSRIAHARSDIRAIETALDIFRLDNFRYPTDEEGLLILTTSKKANGRSSGKDLGPYLLNVPKDPWGNDYEYRNYGENPIYGLIDGSGHADFLLWSWGADGKPCGTYLDQDVGNWDEGVSPPLLVCDPAQVKIDNENKLKLGFIVGILVFGVAVVISIYVIRTASLRRKSDLSP